ncbi:TraU protein [Burkholderia diffusa]|uniref:conjugal transfer protein TraU n=1 Tax=Burkholderia diffusa TaxID=488732 RepID=UPI001CB52529|nr:conjugal transfer protein TraU [Burkholderia diffusa]CAG9260902.1 TraU protein [Burkholderia diffusa]
MGFMEKGLSAIEEAVAFLARHFVGKDMASYCELATAVGLTENDVKLRPGLQDPYILVDSNLSMLTMLDLQGTYQIQSAQDFAGMVENLRVKMNGYMARPGHSITLGFERDPDRALDELMRLAEPQLKAARRMGLKSEDIILDRVRRNAPLVAWEQNVLIVYTHLSVMGDDERKRTMKERADEARKNRLPRIDFGQSPASVLLSLKYRHDTMVARIREDLERSGADGRPGVMVRPIGAHDAIRRIRIMVNRERTAQNFRPVLPGDRFMPHGREDAQDHSDLVPPSVNYQICSNNVEAKRELIKTADLWHGNLSMELGPQEVQKFAGLFESVDREMPWRVRIDISPGGLNEMRGRAMLVAFVGMLPENKQIRQSFIDLNHRAKTDAICSMKFAASTWSRDKSETKRRLAMLEKAIQSWGTCQVTSEHGDPFAAWASTIPGFTTKNVANRMVPPLPDALSMLPLQRPATPWVEGGSLIVRTPDGKIYPIQLGSRLQDTWIELISAAPGSGKSVLMNSMNNATVHRPGNVRLPLATIIDVGPSSSGLIQLIKDSLPESRQNEAVYLRLQNSTEYAANPWETQLGARYPTAREREFLVDLMTLFCTDPASKRAPAGCSQVNEMLLGIAYEDRATKNPIMYEQHIDARVDEILAVSGLRARADEEWWSFATWYEVTDMLFKAGYVREASLAQRQAVPVLPDFVAYLKNESIVDLFGQATVPGTNEPLLQYMYRCFTVATSNYALFAGRTRFELDSETRVIAIDLNDVIGAQTPEGKLRTAAMYLFARQLAAKNYFLREEVVMPVIPDMYREYHLKRIADVQDEQKVIAYDEVHNTGGQEAFVATMIKDGREGRKWGIRVVNASQYLTDYPSELLNAATSVYVMKGGNAADEHVLRTIYNVSDEAILRLQREAMGPGPDGGNFLALFKTKVGFIVQILTNTVGPIEMWAFSTTLEDVALRNRLYKQIGTYAARKLLAEHFPLGTALATIERMRAESSDREAAGVVERLATKLAEIHAKKEREALGEFV